ncbi:MAG: cytochrome c3 family protein [Holophagaceae bacterium]|uniref:Cytochrome c3 family protein n=1 Tax=Candidatus Geothrix skivensis TaxID=2954439 RepID=A0A9D7XIW6_9BACT|nr:cytochrome c3 family protein [Candidatus Geothrix skivensis]
MSSPLLKRIATAARLLLFVALIPLAQAAEQAPKMTADLHKAKGVSCADCHGKAKKKTFVSADRCLGCHGPVADLVKKTAAVKPENPHDSPHWGPQMECTVCHRQHEKTVNWCNHCHVYGFKVP